MKSVAIAGAKERAEKIAAARRPRLGFVGTGWIGRLRLEALAAANIADVCAVYDVYPDAAAAAAALASEVLISDTLAGLNGLQLDGLVVATPSAMHAEQCLQALALGRAVFCQKPLARTQMETRQVVEAARRADKLLAVDFSYRYLAGMELLREIIAGGELGEIFAAELIFHNAYGPDKPWFYDVSSAGGGCVMDLGIHLVDLALYLLGGGEIGQVSSRLLHQGENIEPPCTVVEDYATAEFKLNNTHLRLCCSWHLHAGCDAVIEAHFYGTRGGGLLRNVNGSFYDFEIYRCNGTDRLLLGGYPDNWGGRALIDWAARLASGSCYNEDIEQVVSVAEIIDRIYHR